MRNTMLDWIEAADARLALEEARIERVPTTRSLYGPGLMTAILGVIACPALAAVFKPGSTVIYAGLMQIIT